MRPQPDERDPEGRTQREEVSRAPASPFTIPVIGSIALGTQRPRLSCSMHGPWTMEPITGTRKRLPCTPGCPASRTRRLRPAGEKVAPLDVRSVLFFLRRVEPECVCFFRGHGTKPANRQTTTKAADVGNKGSAGIPPTPASLCDLHTATHTSRSVADRVILIPSTRRAWKGGRCSIPSAQSFSQVPRKAPHCTALHRSATDEKALLKDLKALNKKHATYSAGSSYSWISHYKSQVCPSPQTLPPARVPPPPPPPILQMNIGYGALQWEVCTRSDSERPC